MAEVQSIQCPNCGSPLEVTPSTSQARCSYCGSMLRVSRDASGQASAVLDGIRKDTDILAADVVRRRLEEQLEEQKEAWYNLDREYAAARERAEEAEGAGGWGDVILFVFITLAVWAICGKSLFGVSCGLLVGMFIGVCRQIMRNRHVRLSKLSKLKKQYEPRLQALEAAMVEKKSQLDDAEARLDQLGGER